MIPQPISTLSFSSYNSAPFYRLVCLINCMHIFIFCNLVHLNPLKQTSDAPNSKPRTSIIPHLAWLIRHSGPADLPLLRKSLFPGLGFPTFISEPSFAGLTSAVQKVDTPQSSLLGLLVFSHQNLQSTPSSVSPTPQRLCLSIPDLSSEL